MGFWKTIFGLTLRPLIGPPVLGFTMIAAAGAFIVVPTQYESTAAMVLTTPASGGTLSTDPKLSTNLTNPLLQFNDSLRTTAGILILSINTPEVQAQLGIPKGSSTKITVNDGHTNPDLLAVSNNGPFIYIQVDSLSPSVASNTVTKAQQIVRNELADRQKGLDAPKTTYITATDVTPVTTPEAKRSSKWMTAAGAGVAVLIGGYGSAFGLDQWLRRRRRAARIAARAEIPGARRQVAARPTARRWRGPGEADPAGLRYSVGSSDGYGPPKSKTGNEPLLELLSGTQRADAESRNGRAHLDEDPEPTVAMPIAFADDDESDGLGPFREPGKPGGRRIG